MDFHEVSPVHQEQAQQADNVPDDEVQSSVDLELLVLGEVEEVAAEESDEITLIPPAPGREVVGGQIMRGSVVVIDRCILDIDTPDYQIPYRTIQCLWSKSK